MPEQPELWSVQDAAAFWGVSESRARAILANRRIRRVSGYPAEEIKKVDLRQGARTDLARRANAHAEPAARPEPRNSNESEQNAGQENHS
ncbi:hypothetical protein [Saccharopolyspora griseoalba]|uniref:hypothetical protein n=1 Tax=Saccharopolyspora griseoalba TaxID=1431848 RepID=UPI0036D2355C